MENKYTHVVVYDFETYWTKDYSLSKMSPIDYVRDPHFYAQLLAVSVDGKAPIVVEHNDIPQCLSLMGLTNPQVLLIGHNSSGFDNLILSEVYGIQPKCMLSDTIHLARWAGVGSVYGCSLAELATAFKIGQKGTGTVTSLNKRTKEDFTPEEWESFKAYCKQDVQLTMQLAAKLLPVVPEEALLFSDISSKMATNPMFVVDTDILQQYLHELIQKETEARQSLIALLGVPEVDFLKTIRSAKKFEALLRLLNVEVPMKVSVKKTTTVRKLDPDAPEVFVPALAKTDLEFLALQEHPDPQVRELVRLRLEHNTSVPMTRTKALLHMAEYKKPIPVLLKCFHAHTSRYGAGSIEGKSDSLNWQNFAKHNPQMKPMRKAIIPPPGYVIVACDSSQVEARCVAYEAQQRDLLEQFAEHRDPYAELAAKFDTKYTAQQIHDGAKSGDVELKKLRNAGKRAILSCWEADTEVLTDTGWKCISNVSLTDKLWDGTQWVQHKGLISNGKKPVINFRGTSVTPNHMIYDGTSWRTVADLVSEPNCLKSAQRYATDSYKMLQSKKMVRATTTLHTKFSANTATTCTGCQLNIGSGYLKPIVLTVRRSIRQRLLRNFIQTSRLARRLANLLCSKMGMWIGIVPVARRTKNEQCLFNVPVGQNRTGLASIIYIQGRQLAVMHARKRNQVRRSRENIITMRKYAQILVIDADYLIEFRRKLTDALIQMIRSITDTADAVLRLISKIALLPLHTMCLCQVGTTPNYKLTELTTVKAMGQVMYGLLLSTKTHVINGRSSSLKCNLRRVKKSVSNLNSLSQVSKGNLQRAEKSVINLNAQSLPLKNVYDIYDAGPRHSYMVRTKDGSIFLAHNCGYGASANKYADSIWKDGVKLDEDKDVHDKLAAPLHAIYRASNSFIVTFWKTCKYVIEDLARGGNGIFGGPNNDLFEYGTMPLATGDLVPSIKLPSGFILRYLNLRAYEFEGKYGMAYDRWLGKNKVPTRIYGASLTENLTQCLAFQVLIYQADLMRNRGLTLHCNIHDSFATVVPEDLAEPTKNIMLECMTTVPPWCSGLPLDAEAEIGHDFTIV